MIILTDMISGTGSNSLPAVSYAEPEDYLAYPRAAHKLTSFFMAKTHNGQEFAHHFTISFSCKTPHKKCSSNIYSNCQIVNTGGM